MKKTNLKICVGILLATIVNGLEAKVVTLQVRNCCQNGPVIPPIILTNEIAIATNEVAQVVAVAGSSTHGLNNYSLECFWIKDGVKFNISLAPGSPLGSYPVVIAGPALVRMTLPSDSFGSGFCTIKIEPESFPPEKTVIIPAGSGALISLESSNNLIQWMDASPGAYTNVTDNIFFRIRADRIP